MDVVLSSSTKLIFSLFDEFWLNNGRIVLSRNFFCVKIIRIRFARVFQEFFTQVSLGVVILFVSIGSMFQEYTS